jgi:hypothetical protein
MDRHEADEQLRRAIIAHAEAYETADTAAGELLDQVLVLTSWMLPDSDDEPRTAYSTQMIGGSMQHHTATGLCYVAIDILRAQAMGDPE